MISLLESKSKYDIKKIPFKKKAFNISSAAYFWQTYLKKERTHTKNKGVETSELRVCVKKPCFIRKICNVLQERYALLHS